MVSPHETKASPTTVGLPPLLSLSFYYLLHPHCNTLSLLSLFVSFFLISSHLISSLLSSTGSWPPARNAAHGAVKAWKEGRRRCAGTTPLEGCRRGGHARPGRAGQARVPTVGMAPLAADAAKPRRRARRTW
jgi:hypothetical protein